MDAVRNYICLETGIHDFATYPRRPSRPKMVDVRETDSKNNLNLER